MVYVGIDTQGARALGAVLGDTAERTDGVRREVIAALDLAELTSPAPQRLAQAEDGFAALGAGVVDKALLAERFAADPQRTAQGLGATAGDLGAALTGLLGFAGPASLRAVLVGLAPPGADPALDAALARLNPVLLPALLGGGRPEVPAELVDDLRLLALRLGIEHAGPPAYDDEEDEPDSFFGRLLRRRPRGDSEVFWADFWSDGRTVPEVLADPDRLLDWVAGTFELDRRLLAAPALPGLGDVLASYDFATSRSDPDDLAEAIAAAEVEFAAIATWLPAHLVGRDRTGPDATRLAQTLAFAARVGWVDPGPDAGTEQERFAAAVAYLRANRVLQNALLPTGFEGDTDPLAFFNEPGIRIMLELGRTSGVIDDTYLAGVSRLVDTALPGLGAAAAPAELTDQLQQRLFALLASQIPRSMATSPAIQAQFVAALGYLRQATTGADQRQRIANVLAAFRTIAVTGAPALTERQLVEIVGDRALGVLGRARLRLRGADALRNSPEFFLVARQWGLPGGKRQEIGKYKFSWEFDELGVLVGIKRKKKSWLSRALDSIKAVGKAIWESWEENPFKAIFQVGKIALGALALVVPGFQGLGVAALAVNLADAAYHAIEGDWLGAIGAGLAAFTAGADIFGSAATTAVQAAQATVLDGLFSPATLEVLRNARRLFDIGTSVFKATQAESLVDAIGAGLGAVATGLGSGGQLLKDLGGIDADFAEQLIQLGTTARDLTRLVTPAAGLITALNSGDLLAAFANGLSVVAAGAGAVANPRGFLADPPGPAGSLFGFGDETRASLTAIARGTGLAANVAQAIVAADRGQAFLAGSFLAQAAQSATGPTANLPGDPAEISRRIAEVGVLLEAVFKGASPAAAAPLVVDRLTRLTDVLAPGPRPVPRPERNPLRARAAVRDVPGQILLDGTGGRAAADTAFAAGPAPVTLLTADAPAGADGTLAGAEGTGVDRVLAGAAVTGVDGAQVSAEGAPAGGSGPDVALTGGAGAELLVGNAGADRLDGGLVLAQAPGPDEIRPFTPPGSLTGPGITLTYPDGSSQRVRSGDFYLPFDGRITLPDGRERTLDDMPGRAPDMQYSPGGFPDLRIHFVDPDRIPMSQRTDGLGALAFNQFDPVTGRAVLSDAGPPGFAAPPAAPVPAVADVFDPAARPAIVDSGLTIVAGELAKPPPPFDYPPPPPGPFAIVLDTVRGHLPSWLGGHEEEKPFPEVDRNGFTSNPVLDGEEARSYDVTIGAPLTAGTGVAVRGPLEGSMQGLGGFRFGLTASAGTRAPVSDFSSVTYTTLNSAVAFGYGYGVGVNTASNLVTGAGSEDYFAVLTLPYLGTLGGHVKYTDDGPWELTPADPNDLPDLGVVGGPGVLVGVDGPIRDPETIVWLLSQATGEPIEDVRLNSYVPAGTRLTFQPDGEVMAGAEAGFAGLPGFGYAAGDGLGPALTGTEIGAIAPPGTQVEFGALPGGFTPADDDLSIPSLANLQAFAPEGVVLDPGDGTVPDDWWGSLSAGVADYTSRYGDDVPSWTDESWNAYIADDVAWSQASLTDTDTWPLPDGLALGTGTSDLSLGGGYEDFDSDDWGSPPIGGYTFDDASFSGDAWSDVDIVDYGGEW